MVNGPDDVYVERKGPLARVGSARNKTTADETESARRR